MNFGVENRFRFKQELRCLERQKQTDWILAQEKWREGYTFFPSLPCHFSLGSPLRPPPVLLSELLGMLF